jgi:hypothetical protein
MNSFQRLSKRMEASSSSSAEEMRKRSEDTKIAHQREVDALVKDVIFFIL